MNWIKTVSKRLLTNRNNLHIQGSRPNIFLFASARSGSTWLMELIGSAPGIKVVNEPFLMTRFIEGRSNRLPANWDFVLPHDGREETIRAYIADYTRNRVTLGTPTPGEKGYSPITTSCCFKILRCHDMMNWFENELGGQVIYLVRHPIPVAISRSRYSLLPLTIHNDDYCQAYLTPDQRGYCLEVLNNGTELEKKVLDWCLKNLPPMKFHDRRNWICVSYEHLVVSPQQTLTRIAKSIGLRNASRLVSSVATPSVTTRHSSKDTVEFLNTHQHSQDRSPLISKWRGRISVEEERAAFSVLHTFGLDWYEFGSDVPTKHADLPEANSLPTEDHPAWQQGVL